MKKIITTLLFAVATHNLIGQEIKVLPENIDLSRDIFLKLPNEAAFIKPTLITEKITYDLSIASDSSILALNNGKLFNPKLVSRAEKFSELLDAFPRGMELEAEYIAKATSDKFTFKFDTSMIKQIGEGIGIHDSVIYLPGHWVDSFQNTKILNVWFVCFARIDSKGFPIEKRDHIKPLFIQTESKMFDVRSTFEKLNIITRPAMLPSFSDFVLRDCSMNREDLNMFNQKIKDKIIDSLSQPPISADLYSDLSLPEDEIWLRREYKRSIILGSPYFELSTYILKWKIFDLAFPNGIKFYITHSITKSVGINGIYSEPEDNDFKKYQEKIRTIVNSVVRLVCNEYGLIYSNNQCKCN